MEYQIYKQFPEDISEDSETYENLSAYLMSNGVRNVVELNGKGREWKVRAQLEDLEMKVSFDKVSALFRKPKTEMVGEIKTKDYDKKTQIKAAKLCQILSGYIPSTPKEDEE